jgi:ATP-dependent Clp protease ATP-binding subunit ClpA
VLRVVDKLVVELEAQLESNNVTLELSDAARKLIADKGYDPKMGARPMSRVIQEKIKRPLAEKLLFGDLVDGGHVTIVVDEEGEIALQSVPEPKQLEHKSDEPKEPAHNR